MELTDVVINDLFLSHREVTIKRVRRYVMWIKECRELEPVAVTFCRHDGRNHLSDGHHRTVAYYLCDHRLVKAKVESCLIYDCSGDWEEDSYSFAERVMVRKYRI